VLACGGQHRRCVVGEIEAAGRYWSPAFVTRRVAGGRAVGDLLLSALYVKSSFRAPALDSRFAVVDRRSNWSERHAAFVAGLGTFSLNRSLITELGSAGRLFSVVTELALKPTPRPYTKFDEYCTKCGACIRRCPPRAVDENGKDNAACSQYLQRVLRRYQPRYGCGKCQTAVPCEGGRPSLPNAKAAKPGPTAR
jgi:epoxyqueuosine reductase QueG